MYVYITCRYHLLKVCTNSRLDYHKSIFKTSSIKSRVFTKSKVRLHQEGHQLLHVKIRAAKAALSFLLFKTLLDRLFSRLKSSLVFVLL